MSSAKSPLTERLNEELAAVRAELTRLDGKCSTLAGLSGAALAFVATQAVGAAIAELDRLANYAETITDPGQGICEHCRANVSIFHGATDFTHWEWIADTDAPLGRRVQTYDADHDPRPSWPAPPRPDWREQDTDLTPGPTPEP